MRHAPYDAAERELAYQVWRTASGNMTETLRLLDREHDLPIARQTLFTWRDEGGWVARGAADDAEARRRERAAKSDTLTVLASLEVHREHYERYFASLAATGEVDPKATSAYSNLLRVILAIKQGLSADLRRETEAEEGRAAPREGGLSEEALAEIERRIGLR